MSYHSKNISIEISMFQNELITYYVAEIYIRSSENISSGLSNGIDDDSTQTITEISNNSNGAFAIYGDFYNSRDGGVIIRNEELLRDEENSRGLLVLFNNGIMQIYDDENISREELLESDAEHSFCFGPKLVENGNPVDNFDEFIRPYIRQLQPRCAVGQIEPYHYVFVKVDGRAPGYSQGVTLVGLFEIMYGLGCKVAYNLDGGDSTTMVLLGNLINKPVGRNKERAISDAIVIKESES